MLEMFWGLKIAVYRVMESMSLEVTMMNRKKKSETTSFIRNLPFPISSILCFLFVFPSNIIASHHNSDVIVCLAF